MPEMLDVLDENGHKTGATKVKQDILRDGDWRKVVHIWVVNDAEELLVQQRATGRGIFDGLWDVSVGGGVASGEASDVAAARELGEELGIDCTPDDLEYLGTWKIQPKPVAPGKVMKDFSDIFLLCRDVDLTLLTLEPAEVSDAKYLPLSEFKAQIKNLETYPLWVPHGSEYYLGVLSVIRELT